MGYFGWRIFDTGKKADEWWDTSTACRVNTPVLSFAVLQMPVGI